MKQRLFQALGDIEIAMKLIKNCGADENPVDSHYNSLKCDMISLPSNDANYMVRVSELQCKHIIT